MTYSFTKLAIVLALSLQAAAQSLTVTKSGVIGSGCPAGTADISLSNNVVSVAASNFVASTGPGVPYSSGRKNCQATLSVNIPRGYQFAFKESRLPVQVVSERGTQVTATSAYYFQGEATEDQNTATVPAGASGSVTLVNSFAPSAWSSCGGSATVSINNALRASNSANRSASGSVRLRGTLNTRVVWRAC